MLWKKGGGSDVTSRCESLSSYICYRAGMPGSFIRDVVAEYLSQDSGNVL